MPAQESPASRVEPRILLGVVLFAVAVSAIDARDHGTWLLEVAPVAIGVVLLTLSYRRFPLTPMTYRAMAVAALFIALGAHYSYADVPVGEWLRSWFDLDRNHYDRIGHLVQGAVAALLLREVLIRCTPLRTGWWLLGVVTLCCLGVSGGFEVIEAIAGALSGQAGNAYLGTQGDEFDAQWDMVCALTGAVVTQLTVHRAHDRQLESTSDVRA